MGDPLPVYVNVRRADGTSELVRVGTAEPAGDGFALQLGELTIGAAPAQQPWPARAAQPRPSPGGAPAVFPNYGRSKGAPIAGASQGDLEYYANGCRRTLGDPGKSRWHDRERELLAAIEAEMTRQGMPTVGGGARPAARARPSFMESAPTSAPPGDPEPPPLSDDDVPF